MGFVQDFGAIKLEIFRFRHSFISILLMLVRGICLIKDMLMQ